MPLPNYKYGKVTSSQVYPYLTVMSERGESPFVCCGYCSAGMACRTARNGLSNSMKSTAHPIRSHGGRPHNNGARASELRAGAKGAHNVTLSSVAKADIPNRLRAGYAVVINIDYADLPSHLKVQSNNFGHSVTLFGWREDGNYCGVFDPLWNQGAQGAWAKWTEVRVAMWADGNHSTTRARLTPPPPPPPPGDDTMDSFSVPAVPSTVAVKQNAKLYDNSGYVSDMQTITIDPGPRDMPIIGNLSDGRIVSYVNASGVDQHKAYWVKSADLGAVTEVPALDEVAIRRAEYDRIEAGATAVESITVDLPPRP